MATPPDFTAGQVLTAAQMNKVGLWLVSETTIGTAVASVTVSNAFSADYDNYLIKIDNVDSSSNTTLEFQLDGVTTTYYYNGISMSASSTTVTGLNGSNVAQWQIGGVFTSGDNSYIVELRSPFLAQRTLMSFDFAGSSTWRTGGGMNADTSSRSGFVLTPTTGTITGGTIRVYGYNGA